MFICTQENYKLWRALLRLGYHYFNLDTYVPEDSMLKAWEDGLSWWGVGEGLNRPGSGGSHTCVQDTCTVNTRSQGRARGGAKI